MKPEIERVTLLVNGLRHPDSLYRSQFCSEAANEIERMRAALYRISKCEDAPEIDATGEWQFGLYCGVEDRACRDRYDGADYGHAVGVEKGLEWAMNEAKAALEPAPNPI